MRISTKGIKKAIALLWCLIFASFFLQTATGSYAEEKGFPKKAIKLIVHVSPGSSGDLWARAWSDEFSKLLRVPVVISNQGGASGMNALIAAKSAAADGYTITIMAHSHVVGFAIASDFPVDLFKDFTPVGGFGIFPWVIAVEASSTFQTYEDLADYARRNPGKLKYGSPGVSMLSHLGFELLKRQGNLDIVTVPFKSSAEVTTALVGKHVDLAGLPPQTLWGFVRSGRVRFLLSTQRFKEYPNVPTFADKGLKEAGINGWMGIATRAEVPQEAYRKLVETFEKVAKDRKIVAKLDALGYTPEYANPTEFLTLLKRDYEKIKKVAKEAGISN